MLHQDGKTPHMNAFKNLVNYSRNVLEWPDFRGLTSLGVVRQTPSIGLKRLHRAEPVPAYPVCYNLLLMLTNAELVYFHA